MSVYKSVSKSVQRSVQRSLRVPASLGGSSNPLDSISGVLSWVADPAYITLSGSDVTAWTEKYNGTANFAFASSRPVYAATGGPTGGSIITKPSGRNLLMGSAPIVGSPYSIYAVVRTPTILTGSSAIIVHTGVRSGANGFRYDSATGSFHYIGQGSNFSTTNYDAQRTIWMLLCLRVYDNNSFHVEIGDEPVSFKKLDTAGVTQTTILDFGTTFNDIEISEWHLVPSVLSEELNAEVKQYLVSQNSLALPTKKVLLFGDSHANAVQSGSPIIAPFRTNLLADESNLCLTQLCANGLCAGTNDNSATDVDFKYVAPTYAQSKWSSYKLILCYGTNDCATADAGHGWTSWAAWKARYKSDIQLFITAGWNPADICIMTPPLSTHAYTAGNLTTVKDLIKEIATELSLTLVDWWQLCTDAGHDINALGGDGIHGNDVTHALVRTPLANFI